MDTLIPGIALLCFLIGGGLFLVNSAGGSGFDMGSSYSWFSRSNKVDTGSTPKIIPRFRYGRIVGSIIFLVGVGIMLLT